MLIFYPLLTFRDSPVSLTLRSGSRVDLAVVGDWLSADSAGPAEILYPWDWPG
jgi:hypothetical protein